MMERRYGYLAYARALAALAAMPPPPRVELLNEGDEPLTHPVARDERTASEPTVFDLQRIERAKDKRTRKAAQRLAAKGSP